MTLFKYGEKWRHYTRDNNTQHHIKNAITPSAVMLSVIYGSVTGKTVC